MTGRTEGPVGDPPPGAPWDLPFAEAPLVWLDLEMTGRDASVDRICEVAALRVVGGHVVDALVTLIAPGVPVGESEAIHHISDAALLGAPPLAAVGARLAQLLEGAVLVGHAIHFDLAFLEAAAERGELAPPPVHALDTRRIAKRAWHRSSYGLAALCAGAGVVAPTHRAEEDARACGALLEVLRRELRVETPRHLHQAQVFDGTRRFRDDVEAALARAAAEGRPVDFCYRVPGRDPFVDTIEIETLHPPHVDGHLRTRAQHMTLRGDRFLWASLSDRDGDGDRGRDTDSRARQGGDSDMGVVPGTVEGSIVGSARVVIADPEPDPVPRPDEGST